MLSPKLGRAVLFSYPILLLISLLLPIKNIKLIVFMIFLIENILVLIFYCKSIHLS